MTDLLTAAEVAERLKVTTRVAYKWLEPGGPLHPMAVRIGDKTVRVRADLLEEYIKRDPR